MRDLFLYSVFAAREVVLAAEEGHDMFMILDMHGGRGRRMMSLTWCGRGLRLFFTSVSLKTALFARDICPTPLHNALELKGPVHAVDSMVCKTPEEKKN